MNDRIIKRIKQLLEKDRLTRKAVYESLLIDRLVEPNSEKLVFEILEYCIENKIISSSRLKTWRKKRGKLPEAFSMEQLVKLFDEVARPKLAICMWLGFFAGLRVREVCNLQISDIDLQNKRIFVRNSKNTNRSLDGYGKDRVVTLPDIAIPPIQKWLEILNGGKWFIPSMQDKNKPLQTKTLHEQYRDLLKRCDLSIPDYVSEYRAKNHGKKKDMRKTTYLYRFHTLRHTYASYLLDKGVPIENISKSLGHNQLDTTMIYAKVRDKKTSQFVNDAFSMPMRIVNRESLLNPAPSPEPKPILESEGLKAEEILKKRLAKGEIDLVTFRRLLAEISPESTINIVVKKEHNE